MDPDYYVQLEERIRDLLHSFVGSFPADPRLEVEELLEHAEYGEAVRGIAWTLAESGIPASSSQVVSLSALAHLMGTWDEIASLVEAIRVRDS